MWGAEQEIKDLLLKALLWVIGLGAAYIVASQIDSHLETDAKMLRMIDNCIDHVEVLENE